MSVSQILTEARRIEQRSDTSCPTVARGYLLLSVSRSRTESQIEHIIKFDLHIYHSGIARCSGSRWRTQRMTIKGIDGCGQVKSDLSNRDAFAIPFLVNRSLRRF